MYNCWFPLDQATTRDILVISQEKTKIQSSNFGNHYRNLSKIIEITIKKQGKWLAAIIIAC